MKKAQYKFLRVHNKTTFFCEVQLAVERQSDGLQIRFECPNKELLTKREIEEVIGYEDWQIGAKAGIEFASSKAGIANCTVIVTSIKGTHVDTNPITVAGANAFAFFDAVDFAVNSELRTTIESKIFCGSHKTEDKPSLFD